MTPTGRVGEEKKKTKTPPARDRRDAAFGRVWKVKPRRKCVKPAFCPRANEGATPLVAERKSPSSCPWRLESRFMAHYRPRVVWRGDGQDKLIRTRQEVILSPSLCVTSVINQLFFPILLQFLGMFHRLDSGVFSVSLLKHQVRCLKGKASERQTGFIPNPL